MSFRENAEEILGIIEKGGGNDNITIFKEICRELKCIHRETERVENGDYPLLRNFIGIFLGSFSCPCEPGDPVFNAHFKNQLSILRKFICEYFKDGDFHEEVANKFIEEFARATLDFHKMKVNSLGNILRCLHAKK